MEASSSNISKIRVHDAIVGFLYLLSIFMASQFHESWIYMAVGVAVLQIISPLTKFCPVYVILNKLMPNTEPIQNGR